MELRAVSADLCPAHPNVVPLDVGRWHLWLIIRDLFPPHAKAVQTDSGSIAISWSLDDDPHASQATAAPILVRGSRELFKLLELDPLLAPGDLEEFCLDSVKRGLTGYDPYAEFPQLRVITLEEVSSVRQ